MEIAQAEPQLERSCKDFHGDTLQYMEKGDLHMQPVRELLLGR